MKTKKVCPNCGSIEIDYASMRSDSGSLVGIGLAEKYYCPNCGYRGSVILKMTPSQIKKHRFSKKPWHSKPGRKEGYKSVEVIKPVFITVLLLFFFMAFILMIPRYEIASEQEVFEINQFGSVTYLPDGKEILITEQGEYVKQGQKYLKVSESSFVYIEDATGLKNVGGFLVPAFFMFFLSGFFILMIYSHWHRVKFFTN